MAFRNCLRGYPDNDGKSLKRPILNIIAITISYHYHYHYQLSERGEEMTPDLLKRVRDEGHTVFDDRFQLNIIGIRSPNRDQTEDLTLNPQSITTGFFGINIHKSSKWSENIGPFSAGCSVFQSELHFEIFMSLCHAHAALYSNKFTYTLLED